MGMVELKTKEGFYIFCFVFLGKTKWGPSRFFLYSKVRCGKSFLAVGSFRSLSRAGTRAFSGCSSSGRREGKGREGMERLKLSDATPTPKSHCTVPTPKTTTRLIDIRLSSQQIKHHPQIPNIFLTWTLGSRWVPFPKNHTARPSATIAIVSFHHHQHSVTCSWKAGAALRRKYINSQNHKVIESGSGKPTLGFVRSGWRAVYWRGVGVIGGVVCEVW